MWKLVLIRLEMVLILTQDRCTVCIKRAIGSQIVLDTPNGTPRGRGSCGISLLSLWRHCYCRCKIGARFVPKIPEAHKSFWTHRMILLGDEAQAEAHFGSFGDGANLDAR